jgi:hypothetical protein
MGTSASLKESGWTAAEVKRLRRLKQRYRRGELGEDFSLRELRRLEFLRWLTQQRERAA